MKISMGCDHGAYNLKETLKKYLTDNGYEIEDCGTYSLDSCDYPDFGRAAAEKVASGECCKGIVLCTTGIGISITANKVKGIRCALCYNEKAAEMTRLHNDANVLALGASFVTDDEAIAITDRFLNTEFSNEERHLRRIKKIES